MESQVHPSLGTSGYHVLLWPTTEGALRDLALLVQEEVQRLGYSCSLSGSPVPLKTNIVLGACAYTRHPLPLPSSCIMLNLEQLYDESMWNTEKYREFLRKYPVWDYNQHNIRWLRERLGIEAKMVTFGYSPMMATVPTIKEKDIDVLFYGGLNERRQEYYRELASLGKNVVFRGNDLWGTEKSQLIGRAKIVLNLHYYPTALFEYPRVLHLLNNGAFVITEDSSNMEEYTHLFPGLVVVSKGNVSAMVEAVQKYLQSPEEREKIASTGLALIRKIHTTLPLEPRFEVLEDEEGTIQEYDWIPPVIHKAGEIPVISPLSEDPCLSPSGDRILVTYHDVSWHCGSTEATFRELVEALVEALRGEGWNANKGAILDGGPDPVVILGTHVMSSFGLVPRNAIILDTEGYRTREDIRPEYLGFLAMHLARGGPPVWVTSPITRDLLEKEGVKTVYLRLGFSPAFLHSPSFNSGKEIDVLLYGNLEGSPRRQKLKEDLRTHLPGRNILFVQNIWGQERDTLIQKSRIVLNVGHREGRPRSLELTRLIPLLCNRAFVVSEEGEEGEMELWRGGVVFTDYRSLVSVVSLYLQDEKKRKEISERGYKIISSLPLQLPEPYRKKD